MLKNGSYTRTNGAPETNVYPEFFTDEVEDALASEREGRPIFRSVERVRIHLPGNPLTKPVHNVTNEHRERWPEQYAAFKRGEELAVDGTPLEAWALLKKAMVLELKALGFMTVEQVAGMSDQAMQRIPMYGRKIRELAEAFLDDAKRNALAAQLAADNERKDAEISRLSAQVEELGKQMQEMHTQLQSLRNAPSPIATHVPGLADPVEQARAAQPQPGPVQSSLADLAPRRTRKRATADQGELATETA